MDVRIELRVPIFCKTPCNLPVCFCASCIFTDLRSDQSTRPNGHSVIDFAENLETVPEDPKEISPHSFFAVPRFWEKFYSSIILQMKESTWLEKKIFDWAVDVGKIKADCKLNGQRVSQVLKIKCNIAHLLPIRASVTMNRSASLSKKKSSGPTNPRLGWRPSKNSVLSTSSLPATIPS